MKRITNWLLAATLGCVAAGTFAVVGVGSASAATMEHVGAAEPALLAVYGFPGASTTKPASEAAIGGGLTRAFGFGENLLFQGGNGVGSALSFTLNNAAKTKDEAKETYIGGTLLSNKTGAGNPLALAVQFVDFQDGTLPGFSDTYDKPWIATICPELATTKECRIDARFTSAGAGAPEPSVKIEDVSIDLGPGIVIQGTVWGIWKNGKAAVPPCITLQKKPANAAADQNLFVTQSNAAGIAVGNEAEAVTGEACLISANNDWYKVGAEKSEPEIAIKNT